MEKSYRDELLNNLLIMFSNADTHNIDVVRNILVKELNNYEIVERCTDLVILDNKNEKLIKMFLAAKKVEGGSDRTTRSRQYIYRKFITDINKPLTEVDSVDILYWLGQQQNRVNLNTSDSYRTMIASLFSWLYSNGLIEKNPMESIKPIKHPDPIITSFNDVEIDAMRSACKNTYERAVLELFLSSGVRCNELCNLKWEDINFVTKDITVIKGKGNKNRITMMNDIARKYLIDYKNGRKFASEYVFAVKRKEIIKPRTTESVWKMLKKIAERAEVSNVHPHRFRHTCATILYKRGMDVHMIQRLLGHTNLNTTMVYIDSDVESLRDAYKKCC